MKSLLTFSQYSVENVKLIVVCEGENTVTATKDGITKSAYGNKDTFYFIDLEPGTWTISANNGLKYTSKNIVIIQDKKYILTLNYNFIPIFTYTGNYEILDDDNNIVDSSFGKKDWKIRFLTSGTLNVSNLNGAEDGIDVFLVGGGGGSESYGGGGGGYTKTFSTTLTNSISYNIIVGSGGRGSKVGGVSSAFDISVSGGSYSIGDNGGNGGSGGGASESIKGGSNGSNGDSNEKYKYIGGQGQGTTTREFGESTGRLYAGGGGGNMGGLGGAGGGGNDSQNGIANSGGGAGAGSGRTFSGGSGIVVIRNKR